MFLELLRRRFGTKRLDDGVACKHDDNVKTYVM